MSAQWAHTASSSPSISRSPEPSHQPVFFLLAFFLFSLFHLLSFFNPSSPCFHPHASVLSNPTPYLLTRTCTRAQHPSQNSSTFFPFSFIDPQIFRLISHHPPPYPPPSLFRHTKTVYLLPGLISTVGDLHLSLTHGLNPNHPPPPPSTRLI